MSKIIKIEKCMFCPHVVPFYGQETNYYCNKICKGVSGGSIDEDCKLEDSPKTITDFCGEKI